MCVSLLYRLRGRRSLHLQRRRKRRSLRKVVWIVALCVYSRKLFLFQEVHLSSLCTCTWCLHKTYIRILRMLVHVYTPRSPSNTNITHSFHHVLMHIRLHIMCMQCIRSGLLYVTHMLVFFYCGHTYTSVCIPISLCVLCLTVRPSGGRLSSQPMVVVSAGGDPQYPTLTMNLFPSLDEAGPRTEGRKGPIRTIIVQQKMSRGFTE